MEAMDEGEMNPSTSIGTFLSVCTRLQSPTLMHGRIEKI
jgi:hypothetical protein